MIRRLILRSITRLEVAEAVDWYDAQAKNLGNDFLQAFRSTVQKIRENPLHYQKVRGDLRAAAVERFPYRVIFRANDEEVVIVGCVHARRDPRRWQRRT